MLAKPYRKIATIGENNYYLLTVEDTNYLAAETVIRLSETEEIQQGLRVMPLYSAIVLSMIEALELQKIGDDTVEDYDAEKDGDLGKEEFYPILDVDSLRIKLMQEVMGLGKDFKSRFHYEKNIGSELLKSLFHDTRFQFLMSEQLDSRVRYVWAVKSDRFGNVTFHQALVAGKNTQSEKLVTINTYVFTRGLLGTVLTELQGREEDPAMPIDPVEPTEKEEVQA